jgi:GNAT superfamily N-acetyltransferase
MGSKIDVSIRRRPVTPDDGRFLYDLYADTHPDLASLPLPADQIAMLMRMQFEAQSSAYDMQYPASRHDVILLNDSPVGRLWTFETDSSVHIVDISLKSGVRRQGIGTLAYQQVMADAARITCSVFRFNLPSLSFHSKLGFCEIGEDEMQSFLEWVR